VLPPVLPRKPRQLRQRVLDSASCIRQPATSKLVLPKPCSRASVLGVDGVLREVVDSDLDAFFEHQREPEANRMAAFPARDREAFDAHWRRLLADDSLTKKTIVHEGEVAGNIGCWEQEGRRLVGYWIGREFWGKGLATRALQELTGEVTQRPLHAWVATSNVASIRVLEKCGFVRVGSQKNDVEELLFELRDGPG
jgi:RimJ/RimL family protein N-acetyltransferase